MTTGRTRRAGRRRGRRHEEDADRRASAVSTAPRRIRGILRWVGPRDDVRAALDRAWSADQ